MRIIGNQELDMNEPLWRYFKTDRFLELLDSSQLYFASTLAIFPDIRPFKINDLRCAQKLARGPTPAFRASRPPLIFCPHDFSGTYSAGALQKWPKSSFASARQFEDPFEGAVAVLPPGFPIDPRYAEPEFGEKAFEELRRLTKVSCWHRASYESDAMWQLYAGSRKGVAVRTSPDRIRAAAKPFRLKPEYGHEDLWAGNVTYVDLLKERLRVSMMDRFWYKHMAFAWEQEFRLAVSLRIAEEFGVEVPEHGVKVEFDIAQLIEHICLGPLLTENDAMAIRVAAKTHGR